MRIGIAGSTSTIALEFCSLLADDHGVFAASLSGMPFDLDRYLICTGFLAGSSLEDISAADAERTWRLNYLSVARFCDRVLASNKTARICLMGSESGFSGSYDMAYAGAKAALHLYVERKKLWHPEQMLVALAPHIILDSGMTQRRTDILGLIDRGQTENRMQRWLTAHEVAREAHHLLLEASPALSGQVIRLRP